MERDDQRVRIGLSAVVIALRDRQAMVLTTQGPDGAPALPFGPFDPAHDRTFELALRAFVTAQTGFALGYVEQLYTFGDAGREAPRATPGPEQAREISVGYLALTADATTVSNPDATWTPVFDIFPWEDWRNGPPADLDEVIDRLRVWAAGSAARQARLNALFACASDGRWNEERVLERYELLYEASLVSEADRDMNQPASDRSPGRAMTSDHRRILATGLGRLRSKLKYRPVLFDLMAETFTLSALQSAAEAISGMPLHKQNFRRGVERAGLVEATGRLTTGTGGRPAELFRSTGSDVRDGFASGLYLPALR